MAGDAFLIEDGFYLRIEINSLPAHAESEKQYACKEYEQGQPPFFINENRLHEQANKCWNYDFFFEDLGGFLLLEDIVYFIFKSLVYD